jgi:hypothetical protein
MKEKYLIVGCIIVFIVIVAAVLLNAQENLSGEIVIRYTDSGINYNVMPPCRWKTYYLEWRGSSTTITIRNYRGYETLQVYDGKEFSVYATESVPVTITYNGKTIQFTS